MVLEEKTVLLTGGTGSFGKAFTRKILREYNIKKLIIFSRDELKQFEMAQEFKGEKRIRFFIGDVRDQERLKRALDGVNIVVHAAALKQVPTAEYNPFEAVKTNIMGAQNIINTSIDAGVEKVVALSTDKAANPINLYGATKLVSDKLFIAGNNYSAFSKTKFSVVRYGNVVGSRGSVIPFFLKLKESGAKVVPITDSNMTRFWITLDQGVDLVIKALTVMNGREIFVPKIPSMNIMELAKAIVPECETQIVGIRPGEKIHETLIPVEDAKRTIEFDKYFIITPEPHEFAPKYTPLEANWKPILEGFSYTSDNNSEWLLVRDLVKILEEQFGVVQSPHPYSNQENIGDSESLIKI